MALFFLVCFFGLCITCIDNCKKKLKPTASVIQMVPITTTPTPTPTPTISSQNQIQHQQQITNEINRSSVTSLPSYNSILLNKTKPVNNIFLTASL